MARHYFLRGPKPAVDQPYNPLQKLAYTTTLLFGALSLVSGVALYKSRAAALAGDDAGGYRLVRGWHFLALCGFAAFVPGHLVMVAIHGWRNFTAMLTGWKRDRGVREAVATSFQAGLAGLRDLGTRDSRD